MRAPHVDGTPWAVAEVEEPTAPAAAVLDRVTLRYGDDGLSRGVVYFVTSTVIFYTLGVLIASLGRLTWRESLRRMLRVPAFYAALLAVVVYGLRIPIPAHACLPAPPPSRWLR